MGALYKLIIIIIILIILAISDSTVAFLERLHNRTTKGIEEEIGKRMIFSKSIISQLIQSIDKRVTRSRDIEKMLKEYSMSAKKNEAAEKKDREPSAEAILQQEHKTEDEKKDEAEQTKKQQDEGNDWSCYFLKRMSLNLKFLFSEEDGF